mmetsp:Transcript_27857/g.78073  ORF Transcript_27857/g.78073 Transcript_27857/m.78073 type:complete len:263 (-) Transcript_27857:256-1044(-)
MHDRRPHEVRQHCAIPSRQAGRKDPVHLRRHLEAQSDGLVNAMGRLPVGGPPRPGASALVLHHQLHPRGPLPLPSRRLHPRAQSPSRYRRLQRTCRSCRRRAGRGGRRNRLEAGACRRLPSAADHAHAVLRLHRKRIATRIDDPPVHHLFGRRVPQPGQTWIVGQRHAELLHAQRNRCRVHQQPTLQGLPWAPVAAVHRHDRNALPRSCLLHLPLLQHHPLVPAFIRIRPIFGRHHRCRHVVLRVHPARLLGSVLWIQEGCH